MRRPRTDFPTAVQKIYRVLENGEPFTLNRLSQETKLNFRTVKKAIDFIQINQKSFLEKAVEVSSASDNLTIVRVRSRSGLGFYPESIQKLIIKTSYYPTASREEEILAYLLMANATDDRRAVNLSEDRKLRELVEAEHITKTLDGGYYLTPDGQMIAKGALDLYPELREITTLASEEVAELVIHTQFQQLTIPLPPNPALINMMIADGVR